MNVVSFSFDIASKKWSLAGLPSNLDSERTLVLVFGPPSMLDDSAALSELVRAFPRSHAQIQNLCEKIDLSKKRWRYHDTRTKYQAKNRSCSQCPDHCDGCP